MPRIARHQWSGVSRGAPNRRRRPRAARRPSHARRSHLVARPTPHAPNRSVAPTAPRSVYDQVLAWLGEHLAALGYPRPLRKRLALLVSGLLVGQAATVAGLAQTIHTLAISSAHEPSVVRRLQRTADDPRLAPEVLLPALFRSLLPTLLQAARTAHAANAASGPSHHARFIALRLVVDASTKADQVHLLSVGLAYQGFALPLALRAWEQNVPLPEGEYIAQLIAMIDEVHRALPAEVRPHVLLLADRGFGTPRLLDLLRALGWHWVLRVQDQVKVHLADGRTCPLRELAPRPGTVWVGEPAASPADTPIAAFQAAGWRPCHVVAAWLAEQDAPWLLLTDLDASPARLHDYAQRWVIERLFLSWKSHGWDLEHVGVTDLVRLRALLTGLVVATLWRLAAAIPVAAHYLGALPAHTYRHGHQFRLRLSASLPWPGKFSLFTWGTRLFHAAKPPATPPTLCWEFPDWDAPCWSQRCIDAYYGVT